MGKLTGSGGRFKVKVHRYYKDENDLTQSWDGWFISEVYAMAPDHFLVYDDGEMSSDEAPYGFLWVNYLDMIPECGDPDELIPRVELYEEEG